MHSVIERERQRDRDTERQRDRENMAICVKEQNCYICSELYYYSNR